ncbi:MAG: BamA/TamA family outer membrane protein [Chitinophagaceae bacterium]|nr:BamA/TamA family outer membrane protein [Chitinophagaceae bacterium]
MAKVAVYSFLWVCGWLLIPVIGLQAQLSLTVKSVDKDSAFIQTLKLQSSFKTSTQRSTYINKLPGLLQAKGYSGASIDSLIVDSLNTILYLYAGEKFTFTYLHTDSIEPRLLDAVNWNPKQFEGKPLNLSQLQQLQENLLEYLENTGYPFAKVELDSILWKENALEARLRIEKGPEYKIDSITNKGTASISNRYLQRYLTILNGSTYRKDVLQSVSRKIDELPFVKEQQPWNLTPIGNGSVLNLYLVPKKSSQINVLVGFLPATQAATNIYENPRTKLQFTGEANIDLKNALGNGESIGLNWQQLQVKSPRLNLSYSQSYLFGSAFGINMAFDLLKKDTSFQTITMQLGTQVSLAKNQSMAVFFQNRQSYLLLVDTNRVIQEKKLPAEGDVRSLSIGVQYDGYTTNFRYNPTKGNEWQVTLLAGTKTIKKNSVIVQLTDKNDPNFDFGTLYDTFQLNSFQFRLKAYAAHYFPITTVSTVKTGINLGWYESPNIFRNELFQIGGYRLLRGFDEESIYASRYATTTIEYRYLIGRNSFLFTFLDGGWAQNTASSSRTSNSYIGAGLGMALETKAGIFNISFAAGKRNDLDFSLRQSKIHFGYVNFF